MEKYQEILLAMQEKYKELTGFSPDDASDIGIRLKVLSNELSKLYTNLSEISKQAFVMSSSGEYLERHAMARGITRKGSLKATGKLRFSVEGVATSAITIPKGIICSTVGEPSYRFLTVEDGLIPIGSKYIDIPAQAQEGGEAFNTAPSTVSLMITPASGVSAVSNPTAFIGGVDEESDKSLLSRVEESYRIISNGTNSAYYYQETMKDEEVTSANIIPKKRGVGTVDVVVTSGGVSPSAEALGRISERLSKQREINVNVSVYAATTKPVNISIAVAPMSEYDFTVLIASVKATITEYIGSLNVGEALVLARLGNEVYETEGLYNYRFTLPSADVKPLANEIITCGTITVTRMEV